jgi:hypothetical protein
MTLEPCAIQSGAAGLSRAQEPACGENQGREFGFSGRQELYVESPVITFGGNVSSQTEL